MLAKRTRNNELSFLNENLFSIKEERDYDDDDSVVGNNYKFNQKKYSSEICLTLDQIKKTDDLEEFQRFASINESNLNELENEKILQKTCTFSDKDTVIYPFDKDEFLKSGSVIQYGPFDSIFSKSFSCIEKLSPVNGMSMIKKKKEFKPRNKFHYDIFNKEQPIFSSTPLYRETSSGQLDYFYAKNKIHLPFIVNDLNKNSLKNLDDLANIDNRQNNFVFYGNNNFEEADAPFKQNNCSQNVKKNNLNDKNIGTKKEYESKCNTVKVLDKKRNFCPEKVAEKFDIYRQPIKTKQFKFFKNPTAQRYSSGLDMNTDILPSKNFHAKNFKSLSFQKKTNLINQVSKSDIKNISNSFKRPVDIRSIILPSKINQTIVSPKLKYVNSKNFKSPRMILKPDRNVNLAQMKISNQKSSILKNPMQQSEYYLHKLQRKRITPVNKTLMKSPYLLSKSINHCTNTHAFLNNRLNSISENTYHQKLRNHDFYMNNYIRNIISQMIYLKQLKNESFKANNNHLIQSKINSNQMHSKFYHQRPNFPDQGYRFLLNPIWINNIY